MRNERVKHLCDGKFGTHYVLLVSDGIKCRNDRSCWVMRFFFGLWFFFGLCDSLFCQSVLLCLADDEDLFHTCRMLILVLLTIGVFQRCVLQRYWTTFALHVQPQPVCGRLPSLFREDYYYWHLSRSPFCKTELNCQVKQRELTKFISVRLLNQLGVLCWWGPVEEEGMGNAKHQGARQRNAKPERNAKGSLGDQWGVVSPQKPVATLVRNCFS